MKGIVIVVLLFAAAVVGITLYQSQTTQGSVQRALTTTNSAKQIQCSRQAIPSQTEGPYYSQNSPQTTKLYKDTIPGERVTLSGYVVDTNCKPIANAWIDFWQANGNGEYDNQGYTLRGHQYTDSEGKFVLDTVIPGEYPGRTPHIHFKVRAHKDAEVITSQLYLPNAQTNTNDPIFNNRLVMDIKDTPTGKRASYTIVVTK